jgi:hypothetical protein
LGAKNECDSMVLLAAEIPDFSDCGCHLRSVILRTHFLTIKTFAYFCFEHKFRSLSLAVKPSLPLSPRRYERLAHHRPETNFRGRVRLAALLGSAIWLTGCANLTGQALSTEEIQSQVQADRQSLGKDVAPLTGPVSLEEAIARAIKYNAAQRLRGMEEAVAQGTANVAKFDMLPKLVASAGYRYRDKDLISRSTDSVTGAPSLAHPYISSDRESTLTSLSFSWSLLDFGQSYYAARQHADRAQIAAERRRKAIHTLIQDVRIAYWRVAAAQALESSLQTAGQDADKALEDSRKVEAEKLRSHGAAALSAPVAGEHPPAGGHSAGAVLLAHRTGFADGRVSCRAEPAAARDRACCLECPALAGATGGQAGRPGPAAEPGSAREPVQRPYRQ